MKKILIQNNFRWYCLPACIMLWAQSFAQSPVVINATDFGVKANSYENAAPALRRTIDACRQYPASVLMLPPGRIDVWPDSADKRELYISNTTENDARSKVKNIALLLERCNNITIEGRETLIILHGKMLSFALLECNNIKIRHLAFDYERPTMGEITIEAVSKNRIETVFHPDSRFSVDSGKLSLYGEGWKVHDYHTILFDPVNDRLHYSSLQPLLKATARQTGPHRVVFEGDFEKVAYKAGDVLTVRDPYRDNCGGFIAQSRNIELYDVKMHYMHGLGIVSQFSENITLRKVVVAPRPESGRIIAAFADCFHFSGCRGKVIIDSCHTSGAHDDPVNVHGTHLQITGIDNSGKITVRFMHHQTYGFPAFFPGDSIAFIEPQTLLPKGAAIVKSAVLMNKREMELELNLPAPAYLKAGLCIENLTWTPEVQITNSRFERTNTRGILVTTRRKVLIENNVFYHTGMYPILIADDASSWFESGAVQDVTIRNNLFEGCGYNSGSGAIDIAPENHERVAGRYVHHNIRITGNTFKTLDGKALSAKSVDGLQFTNNKISGNEQGDNTMLKGSISLDACTNVIVKKNLATDHVGKTIDLSGMTARDIQTDWKLNKKP